MYKRNRYGRLTDYQKYVLIKDVLELKKKYESRSFMNKLFNLRKAKVEKRLIKDAEDLLVGEYSVNPDDLKLK